MSLFRRKRCARSHASRVISRRTFLWRQPERLEDRRLLSLSGSPFGLPTPAWFEASELPYGPLTVEQSVVALASSSDSLGESGAVLARDRWIVQLSEVSLADIETFDDVAEQLSTEDLRFAVVRGLGRPGQVLVCALSGTGDQATAALRANPNVTFVESDRAVQSSTVPNDIRFVDEWGLANTGQFGGVAGVDIAATQAWDVTTGSMKVVVGVIDSGIDPTHFDLYQNIWLNQGEIPSALRSQLADVDGDQLITFRDLNDVANDGLASDVNQNGIIDALDLFDDPRWGDGIDEDRNGFPDDLFGWDFRNHTPFARDEYGHGTHVAGTIGATGNNGIGVAGVNWAVSLMSLKFLGANNEGTLADAVAAINYATMMRTEVDEPTNVRVLNASWGQAGDSPALESALEAAGAADILLVAAAGNGNVLGQGMDIDQEPFYPASYDLPNIISVAANGQYGELAGFSNYGVNGVDLAAPGIGILSTKPGNAYVLQNGTSMAAPHVAGAAALAWSQVTDATVAEVRGALLQNVALAPELSGKVATGGRVNAYRAVMADTFAPRAVAESLSDISSIGTDPQRIGVRYWSNTPLDFNSFGDGDLIAHRTWGEDVLLSSTLAAGGVTVISPTECLVSYELAAPGGTWDVWDYGTYVVRTVEGQVSNTSGLTSPERVLGEFRVQIDDPHIFYVNSCADSVDVNPGDGLAADASGLTTLRAAVIEANALPGAQTIVLQAGTYAVTIAGKAEHLSLSGDLDITDDLTILGAGGRDTVLDAGGLDRMMQITPSVTVQVTGVTIQSGYVEYVWGEWDGDGGAIVSQGTLTLTDCCLQGNASRYGGAVYSLGSLTIIDSTIQDNTCEHGGGGIHADSSALHLERTTVTNNSSGGLGGGVYLYSATAVILDCTIANNLVTSFDMASGGGIGAVSSLITVINTTISGNTAATPYGEGRGGGVLASNSALTLLNCTITDNAARTGGGIAEGATIQNTIVAGNHGLEDPDVNGGFTSSGGNLIGELGTAGGFGGPGDQIVADAAAYLGPLQDHGGPTWTHELLLGSTAIDAGVNGGAPSFDQRGIARPYDADYDGQAIVDAGAFERFHVEVHGLQFHDLNGNRDWDAGEPRLGGATVFLDANDNGVFDAGEAWTTTRFDDPATLEVNEIGTYSFTGLEPGVYRVAQVFEQGWEQTLAGFGGVRRVSLGTSGSQPMAESAAYAVSADGQFVAFGHPAALVPEDTNGREDVFVLNRATGDVERVNVASDGTQADVLNTPWCQLSISDNGRYVAFGTDATTLVAGDTNGMQDIFVHDRHTRVTERVSTAWNGAQSNGHSWLANGRAISGDGRYIAFSSNATNLVPGDTNGNYDDVFVFDRQTQSIERVNVAYDGTQANAGSRPPTISADGQYVSFFSYATNLLPGVTSEWDVFVYDRSEAELHRVNLAADGTRTGPAEQYGSLIAADGRHVLFKSGGSGNLRIDIRDWQAGVNVRVPASTEGQITGNTSQFVSGDGRYVAVAYSNLDAKWLYDLVTGTAEPADVAWDGTRVITKSFGVVLSADGSYLAYDAAAAGIIPNDTNFVRDVFAVPTMAMRYRRSQQVTLLPGQVARGIDFGCQALPGAIRGTLFDDLDKDGVRDPGEEPLAGWTMYLDADQDGRLDANEASTLTVADGTYEFTGLEPLQSYTVAEVARDGWEQTSPGRAGNFAYTMYVDAGAVFAGRDFGNAYVGTLGQSMNGVIQGRVFQDVDNDGQQDPGEAGMADQVVFLDMNDNDTRDFNEPRKVTDANGDYVFTDLGPASYTARLLTTDDQQQLSPLGNQLASEHYATGASSNPKFLAPGDFDQDGRQDIAVVNQDTNSLLILRNNGSSFVPGTPIDVGFAPSSAVVYDVDGVHGPDLIVSNLYSSTATILLNNGTGGFAVASEVYVGSLPASLALGDLNHDGRIDLVVANQNAYSPYFPDNNQVSVLFGTASGWFSGPTAYVAGSNPSSVATAYVNTDDYLDLVVANGDSDSVSVLINQGNGTFLPAASYPVGAAPSCIVAEDLSGDGRADIVVTNALGNTVSVLINHGNGTFQAAKSAAAGTGPVAVSVVDLEGDGDRDLVVANRTNQHLAVLRNQGNGTFEPPESYGVGDFPTDLSFAVTTADFNGDGVLDVTVANGQADNISVLRNTLVPGAHRMAIVNGTEVFAGVNFTVQSVQTPLQVTSFTTSPSGFSVEFNRAPDPDTLNLYGGAGAADVTVVGAQTGTVRGSLLVQDNRITWLATGGVLTPDQYTVTLRSAADAFSDRESGDLMDGNRDRVPGGDYVTSMVAATRAANTVIASIPDFARGYGQSVNLPASDLVAGLPLQLSNGQGVSGLDLRVHYDPTLLEIHGFTPTSAVQAAGASALLTFPTPGTVILTISSPHSLATGSGPLTVGSFTASVPAEAPYAAKQLLDIADLFVFDDTINLNELPSVADDALHVVAYFGDTNGSGTYNAPDTALVQRMIGELTTGLTAYRLIDPKVLADITLNGLLQANDTTSIQRVIGQVAVPNVPALPDGLPAPPADGPDPFVYIPQDLAAVPGDTLSVPVKINVTESAGITLGGFDLTIEFDPTRLSIDGAQLGSLLTSAGFAGLLSQPVPGTLIYTASSATGTSLLPAGTQGDLVTLSLTVLADAASGPTAINVLSNYGRTTTALFSADLEDLSLVPAPTNAPDDTADGRVTITAPAQIVGRHVFYNRSAWDGNNGAANAADDGAIAPDKFALLPGGTATFANYTSYDKGLNGLMIDVRNLAATPTVDDFFFRVGNSDTPFGKDLEDPADDWPWAPTPISITVRSGAGPDGTDRVTLLWADSAIRNRWLQVTVMDTDNTGLATQDVFYFGNAVGESGSDPNNALVNATDEIGARNNPHSPINPAANSDAYDFNRDKLVNATDQIIARNNRTSPLTALKLIHPPLEDGGSGEGDGDGGVQTDWLGRAPRRPRPHLWLVQHVPDQREPECGGTLLTDQREASLRIGTAAGVRAVREMFFCGANLRSVHLGVLDKKPDTLTLGGVRWRQQSDGYARAFTPWSF